MANSTVQASLSLAALTVQPLQSQAVSPLTSGAPRWSARVPKALTTIWK